MNDIESLIESITRYLAQGRPFISILSPADDLLLQARDMLLQQAVQLQEAKEGRDLAFHLMTEHEGSKEKAITSLGWW